MEQSKAQRITILVLALALIAAVSYILFGFIQDGLQDQSTAPIKTPGEATESNAEGSADTATESNTATEGNTETEVDDQARDEAIAYLASLARLEEGDSFAAGALDAPVVIVEYADFRCPYCAKFATETFPSLWDKYGESGQVRFEWRNLPLFGEESQVLAQASWAAGQQGKFWEFQHAAFDLAPAQGRLELSDDEIVELAGSIGVGDLEQFSADMNSPEAITGVQRDSLEAREIGLQSVPAFLVNGIPVQGAQPLEVFEQVIDQELTAASSR